MKKVRFIRPVYFVWLVFPALMLGIYQLYGLPHVIWSYAWLHNSRSYGDFESRHYTRCTFIGPYGAFTVRPDDGHCGWFLFAKRSEGDA